MKRMDTNKKDMDELLKKASQTYEAHFDKITWYGRCIFLSWYCDLGTCKFCFRSTTKHKITHAKNAKRSVASVLVEALLCRELGWRIEFLTGGYKIFPMKELVEITRLISEVYGEKIWLNLGAISPSDLDQFRPHIKGIVSSIETIEKELHDRICPDKPIKPYEDMFEYAQDLKKSMTIVIGLGEKKEDLETLTDFIKKHNLERITFYALKPVKETPLEDTKGPDTEWYLWWIAQTRIRFPKLQIIAGTTPRRYEEVGKLMLAGANAFTKFPATKMFGTKEAHQIEQDIQRSGRSFKGTITVLPRYIKWNQKIEALDIKESLKEEMKDKLNIYLSKIKKNCNIYELNLKEEQRIKR